MLEILHASQNNRLWLAFLTSPVPGPEESPSSSLELAARSAAEELPAAMISAEVLHDELRVLLAFWLEMPLQEYLDDLEAAGPAVAAIRDARRGGPLGRLRGAVTRFNLKALVAGTDPVILAIPPEELSAVLAQLKLFAKRVHRSAKKGAMEAAAHGAVRRENSMPLEVAQVLYDLAGALALCRCGVRIIGLSDERYRKNVAWVLNQSWLDTRLRPVFFGALKKLEGTPRS